MKTLLVCLALCSLAALAYAAPSFNQKEIEAFISELEDENDGLQIQDEDGDGDGAMDLAELEALLKQQEQATIENFFKKAWKKGKGLYKKGKKLYKKGKKVYDKAAPVVGKGIELYNDYSKGGGMIQGDDIDIALLQALLAQQDEVGTLQSWGSFFKKVKSVGKKALKIGKTVAPIALKGAELYAGGK